MKFKNSGPRGSSRGTQISAAVYKERLAAVEEEKAARVATLAALPKTPQPPSTQNAAARNREIIANAHAEAATAKAEAKKAPNGGMLLPGTPEDPMGNMDWYLPYSRFGRHIATDY